jgi:hypothetical protein
MYRPARFVAYARLNVFKHPVADSVSEDQDLSVSCRKRTPSSTNI